MSDDSDDDQYGKKIAYDPLWKGPMQNARNSTDKHWLITFLIFLIIYACVAAYGCIVGNFSVFGSPSDYVQKVCGVDKDVIDKPYLQYMNLKDYLSNRSLTDDKPPSVCVSKCPTENFFYNGALIDINTIKSKLICTDDININAITTQSQLDIIIDNGKCARWYLKSEPVNDRCLATGTWVGHENETLSENDLDKIKQKIQTKEDDDDDTFKTAYNSFKPIMVPTIIAILFGTVIALTYVILLRWFAVPFVYATIVMLCGILCWITVIFSYQYSETQEPQALGILVGCVFLVIVIVLSVIFFRKKIYLACQLIKESSKAIVHMKSTLLFPFLVWIFCAIVLAFSISVFMRFLTIRSPVYRVDKIGSGIFDGCNCTGIFPQVNERCDPLDFNKKCLANGQPCQFLLCSIRGYEYSTYLYFFHSINFVGLYWILFFVSGFQYMVLGGAFATWYWTLNKSNLSNHTLLENIHRTVRYHLGTVAIGSLILTIVNIISLLLKLIQNIIRESNNGVAQALICCVKCFFDMIKNAIEFLSINAYIMCAIHGKNFFQSAKDSFNLIMRNLLNVIVINNVIDILAWMAVLLIGCLSVLVVKGLYHFYPPLDPSLPAIAQWISFISTVIIAWLFFSVQSTAVRTIFLCFVEDSERNDGSDERPYYMSNKLKRLLQK